MIQRASSLSVGVVGGWEPSARHSQSAERLHIGPRPEKITQQLARFKLSKPESVHSVDSEWGGATSFSLHIVSAHPVKHHWTQVEHEKRNRQKLHSVFRLNIKLISEAARLHVTSRRRRIPSRWSELTGRKHFTWAENILAWSEETLCSSWGWMSQLHECLFERRGQKKNEEKSKEVEFFSLSSRCGDVTQKLCSRVLSAMSCASRQFLHLSGSQEM